MCRETLAAAEEFCELEPWTFFEPDDFFVLHTPESDEPLLGSVIGQSGLERGLMLLRGSEAGEQMGDILDGGGETVMREARMIGFSLTRLADIAPQERSLLKKAGFPGRRESLVPGFVVGDPMTEPRGMRPDEAREMLYVLRGFLKALDTGELDVADLGWAQPTIKIEGDPTDPDVSVTLADLDAREDGDAEDEEDEDVEEWDDDEGDEAEEGAVIARFKASEANDGTEYGRTWLLGMTALGDTGGRPGGWGAGLMDLDSQELRGMTPLPELAPETLVPWVQGVLAATPHGQKPRVLLVSDRDVATWLRPALAVQRVRCEFDDTVAFASEMAESSQGIPDGPETRPPTIVLPGEARPSAMAVESIHFQVADLWDDARHEMAARDLPSDRSIKRYFGEIEVASDLLDDRGPSESLPQACLDNWLWFYYRATKRSKTIAERLLERGLPEEDEHLLRALAETAPTVWRVEETSADGAVFRDVLSAKTVTVQLGAGPVPWTLGFAWIAKLAPWEECWLLSPVGPVLQAKEVAPALLRLAEMAVALTPEGLARDCHLLGRLWDWTPIPRRGVSDIGDHGWRSAAPLAVVATQNLATVFDAVASRPDVVLDVDGTLLWIRSSEGGQLFDNPDVRGLITLGPGAFFLEARTAEDLLEGRGWLSELAEP